MQRHEHLAMKAEQHTRNSTTGKACTHFPQTITHCTAERHSDGPPPLHAHQIDANRALSLVVEPFQPVANGLTAPWLPIEEELDLRSLGQALRPPLKALY